jgi:hypothetical protein
VNRFRRSQRDELDAIREIERLAGRAFAAIGMAEIATDEQGPELRALVQRERRSIPTGTPRVAMRRPITAG